MAGVVPADADDAERERRMRTYVRNLRFACTEAGDPARGSRLVERSLRLHPRNAHAAHALAHVFYEEGDSAGGARFAESHETGNRRSAATPR